MQNSFLRGWDRIERLKEAAGKRAKSMTIVKDVKKTVLLTGSTGFMGSNLLRSLLQQGYNVIITTRDITDPWRIKSELPKVVAYNIDKVQPAQIFLNHAIDIIVHCATNYGRKEIDNITLLKANLILPLTLLQLGVAHKVKTFINTDTVLDKRVSYYSLSKYQFKEWLNVYSSEITSVNVCLEHFYGPFDDNSKFVTFIIQSLLKGVEQIDLTKGEQKRDFIYIDDVVDAFLKIIENSCRLGTGFYQYEIGSGRTIAIRDFVMLAKKFANNHNTLLNFGALPYRQNEVMESEVDISEIRKLGWHPRTTLEEGLKKTIHTELEEGNI